MNATGRSSRHAAVAAVALLLASISPTRADDDAASTPTAIARAPSPQAAALLEVARRWPTPELARCPQDLQAPPCLRVHRTPGRPMLVGVEVVAWIAAPAAVVTRIMDDVDSYDAILPGYKDIHVIERRGDETSSSWEVRVPVIPNIRYELDGVRFAPTAASVGYRYSLRASARVRATDGLVVVEDVAPGVTRYVEHDFFEVDWGLLRWFAKGAIWKGGLESVATGAAAIKIRAEQPDLPAPEVQRAARRLIRRDALEAAMKAGGAFFGDVLPEELAPAPPAGAAPAANPRDEGRDRGRSR